MKTVFRTLLYSVYLCIVTFVLLECLVRLWGYSEHSIYDPIYMPFYGSSEIPYVHKPNLRNKRANGLADINTDSLGLRSTRPMDQYSPKQDNEYRIAVVGDSYTFGAGVKRTEDTFCAVTESVLNQKQNNKRVRVLNFGALSYSVKEMAATLKHRMLEVKPDLVVLAIIQDDFRLARAPDVDKWGYLCDHRLSGFIPRDSLLKYAVRKARLTYLVRDIFFRWKERRRAENNIRQTAEGIEAIPESYEYVRQFRDIARENNVPYLVVLLDTGRDFGKIRDQLRLDNIEYVDFSWIEREFTEKDYRASKFDGHPSLLVHRRIGEELADKILANL